MTLGFADVCLLHLSITTTQLRVLVFLCFFVLRLQICNSDIGQVQPQYNFLLETQINCFTWVYDEHMTSLNDERKEMNA